MRTYDGTTVLDLPYQARQLIVVADDALVEASQREEEEALRRQEVGLGWVELVKSATIPFYAALPLGRMAVKAYQAWVQAKASGIPVLQIRRSDAAHITFPIGHPRDGVTYVGHPSVPKVYYPMAEFHKTIFEHKLCEAVRLLMHLGAAKIRVEHESGWSADFCAKLSVPLSAGDEKLAGRASTRSKAQALILYEAHLSGAIAPSCPDDLIWYSHEPTWQAVADGRLNCGLRNFSIKLSYTDDFGVNAGLAAKIQGTGLEVGGKFEDYRSTIWRIAGRFVAKSGTPTKIAAIQLN